MDISIIIVSYNTKKLTLDAIKAVQKDTSIKKKEIIVVDNASTDGSYEAIQRLQKKNKNLILIANKNNLGFSKANNQGIRIATGTYVLLLNSDTKVIKGALKSLVTFAKKHKKLGVIGARLLNKDKSLQESCFNLPTIRRAIDQYWFGKKKLLDKYAPEGDDPVKVEAVVGAAMLLTPAALLSVGGLDERYFFYYEDLAYCRSVLEKNLEIYYLPAAKVIHYHGASGKKVAKDKDQWKRLIPSSKTYHGMMNYYIFNFILWSGQKWQRITKS